MEAAAQPEQSLRHLHTARVYLDKQRAELCRRKAEADAQFAAASADLRNAEQQAREIVAGLEEQVRRTALDAYDQNGNKKPFPGLGIRLVTKFVYDEPRALAYAKDHDLALRLDTAVFHDLCKHESTRPHFVEVAEGISVTIATDLSKHGYGEAETEASP